jgi:glycerol dehydrogenase-like iron-containing ADH family enzyme
VLVLPLDGDGAVHIGVPEAEAADVETVASAGNERDVHHVLEVAVGGGQPIDHLRLAGATCCERASMYSFDRSES